MIWKAKEFLIEEFRHERRNSTQENIETKSRFENQTQREKIEIKNEL